MFCSPDETNCLETMATERLPMSPEGRYRGSVGFVGTCLEAALRESLPLREFLRLSPAYEFNAASRNTKGAFQLMQISFIEYAAWSSAYIFMGARFGISRPGGSEG